MTWSCLRNKEKTIVCLDGANYINSCLSYSISFCCTYRTPLSTSPTQKCQPHHHRLAPPEDRLRNHQPPIVLDQQSHARDPLPWLPSRSTCATHCRHGEHRTHPPLPLLMCSHRPRRVRAPLPFARRTRRLILSRNSPSRKSKRRLSPRYVDEDPVMPDYRAPRRTAN